MERGPDEHGHSGKQSPLSKGGPSQKEIYHE